MFNITRDVRNIDFYVKNNINFNNNNSNNDDESFGVYEMEDIL